MRTEAIFENIAERIETEIVNAKSSIYIAVAWFTNKNLFNALVQKSKQGCQILLMYSGDQINENSAIDFDRLNVKSSKAFKIGDGDSDLMHNKFCVIDHSTVITGSYNWSYKAESNLENITISYEDSVLAEQFVSEFKRIREHYYPQIKDEQEAFPLSQIIKRLEILRNFVILEEVDELKRVASKLKDYEFNSDIKSIANLINSEEFGLAVEEIEAFIYKHQQLSIWTDPEIAALKLEVKNFENQINAFGNEKVEIEKILTDFQHRHSTELGDLILEVLKLRKESFKDDEEKFEEAERDEKEYQGQYEADLEKELFNLDPEQKAELKKNYRKASTLCHPDKFSNESIEVQQQAENVFKDLSEAYDKNDLERVNEILTDLKQGILTPKKGESLTDKSILKSTIKRLKKRLAQLEDEIRQIKESETYKTVIDIDDWDSYFEEVKSKLEQELKELRLEIEQ